MKKFNMLLPMIVFFLLGTVGAVHATQLHGDPEGLYVHQVSHVFFACCMAALIYWLRARRLVQSPGWRHVQYAAAFFIAWSLDAALAHILEEQMTQALLVRPEPWRVWVETDHLWLGRLYYLAKLDHLLCAPAMIFLYKGLKHLDVQNSLAKPENGEGLPR